MQDEVNTKVVAIAIKGGKITAEVLDKALKKFVEEIEKAQKTASQPKTYRGKQSIKRLVAQNAAISNIEVTDGNIKSFQRTANKYGIDYALKKDTSEEPPRYIVFITQAVTVLQTLVIALGAGLAVWGVVNLMEGYGNDNPGAKSQGIKQLMAGGGVVLIGTTLIPLLSGLF